MLILDAQMKRLRKILVYLVVLLLVGYTGLCSWLYFRQENILFYPKRLSRGHRFTSDLPLQELSLSTKDGKQLSGLLFSAAESKGLIFYIHGNAGNVEGWKAAAKVYTKMGYDLMVFDFRGFGKSTGKISSEKQFYDDVRSFYRLATEHYTQEKIVIIGYSIGTGPAAMLASENSPRSLILLAPYYNLTDMMHREYPGVPSFILKYKFETDRFLPKVDAPVTIFHGINDKVIYFGSSLKLQKLFRKKDRLFPLKDQGHGGIDANPVYLEKLRTYVGL